MSSTGIAYCTKIYRKYLPFIFGVCSLLLGLDAVTSEVTLTASSDPVTENSSTTLTCSFIGSETVQLFTMTLEQTVKGSLLPDCRIFAKQPDHTLYDYECPTNSQLKWTIKTVTRANEGDTWTCQVDYPGGSNRENYKVSVHVPLQGVSMTSPANNDVTVRENTETVFICTTLGGLPAATVRWFKDKGTISSGDNEIKSFITITTRKTSDDLISVTSTLRYSPPREDNGVRIYCTANNSVNTLTSERQPFLNIQYSPDGPPVINGNNKSDTYKVVDKSRGLLSCSVIGGNPLPTLTWDCFNSGSSSITVGTTVIKNVTWTALLDQARSCTCQSSHIIAGIQTVSIKVQVLNHTSINSFHVDGFPGQGVATVNEHDTINLICNVDSNPEPSLKLTFNNEILKQVAHTKTLALTIGDATCFHTGTYICEGWNDDGQPSNKTLQVFVRCTPRPLHQFKENVTSSKYVSMTLTFTVIAYPEPGPTGFTWHKEVGTRWTPLLSNADIHVSSMGLQTNLTIMNVSHSDYGQYRVTTVNSIGTFEQYLFLTDIKTQTSTAASAEVSSRTINDDTITCKGNELADTPTSGMVAAIILGVICLAVVVYAAIVTVLLKRKTRNKDTKDLNKSSKSQTTYINLGCKHVLEEEGGTSVALGTDPVDSDKQYTSLDPFTKDDNTAYDVIQTHRP